MKNTEFLFKTLGIQNFILKIRLTAWTGMNHSFRAETTKHNRNFHNQDIYAICFFKGVNALG